MNMKHSVLHILPLALLAAALSACITELATEHKGIAVSAIFYDEDQANVEISALPLWFYDAGSGRLIQQSYKDDPRELALELFTLPEGNYTAILGANIASPLAIEGEQSASELHYSLEGISPTTAYSAVADFSTDSNARVKEVKMEMKNFLCGFAIEVENAPDGLTLEIEAINTSDAYYPARKATDGSYGTPGDESKPAVFPPISLSAAAPRSESVLLMPTVLGREFSFWHLLMKDPSGKTLESYIEAPRMNPGDKYLMSLKYSEIKYFMHLSACTISDWTEGWVYTGTIIDPVE